MYKLKYPDGWTMLAILLLGMWSGNTLAENIDPYNNDSQYSYGENIGWLNAEPSGNGGPGVTVTNSALSGYIWAENIGWISLSCTNTSSCSNVDYGVVNDTYGNLSGYGWAENVGWINFAPLNGGVIIDPDTGNFSGHAWGENIGWISFSGSGAVQYKTQTGWMPPVVSLNPNNSMLNEGDTLTGTGSFTDTNSVSGWTGTVDYGDSSGVQALTIDESTKSFVLNHTYVQDGTYSLTVSITDEDGGTGTKSIVVTVNNVAPVVGTVTVVESIVAIGDNVALNAGFTDAGVLDSHTATIDWGDGTAIAQGTVSETNGSGTVSGSHAYATVGLYTVTVAVTDEADTGTNFFQYVVVYDPSAGFVSGSGWIDSPPGAYAADPSLSGKATFGFNAKYNRGANTPDGNTEFVFTAGNFNFHSTSYDWLVVAGARAQFKGVGTVNGETGYGFMLTAIDGQVSGGGGMDKFRIKVWVIGGDVVYDNMMGADDDADPSTTLGGGKIIIHSN